MSSCRKCANNHIAFQSCLLEDLSKMLNEMMSGTVLRECCQIHVGHMLHGGDCMLGPGHAFLSKNL